MPNEATPIMPDGDEQPSLEIVQAVARLLPLHMMRRAVAIALATPDVALRAEFIRALRDRLSPSAPHDVAEARDLTAFLDARPAISLTTLVTRIDAYFTAVRLLWLAPEFGRWLADLFPKPQPPAPPVEGLDEALAAVLALPDEAVRARGLALLAPLLGRGRDRIQAALGAAGDIRDESTRAKVLAALARQADGSTLRTVVEVAEGAPSPEGRAFAVAVVAPYLAYAVGPLGALLRRTLHQVAECPVSERKARALTAMAPITRGLYPDLAAFARAQTAGLNEVTARLTEEALTLPWPQEYRGAAAILAEVPAHRWRSAIERLETAARESTAARDHAIDAMLAHLVGAIGGETPQTPRMDRGGGEQSVSPSITDESRALIGKPAPPPPSRERFVNLGFATKDRPGQPLPRTSTLGAYYAYVFWVEIGARLVASIDQHPAPLLPGQELPTGGRLEVVLFAFPGGFSVPQFAATGELEVGPAGDVLVARQPGDPPGCDYHDLRRRRLFFRVTAPTEPGRHRLRCNIYYERNLVQSHLVTAEVTRVPAEGPADALTSVVDYSLSKTLDPGRLKGLNPQTLSMMLNQNGGDTHGFFFYGSRDEGPAPARPPGRPFQEHAAISGQDLQNLIEIARGALRKAAWGDAGPWQQRPGQSDRYNGRHNRQHLEGDLTDLARAGFRMYDAIANKLAGGPQRAEELRALMASHGFVQVALKEQPSHVFPAALLYDYPIDSNADLTVCPAFLAALDGKEALDGIACFNGGCAARGSLTVVCPGGFWGYRHAIGLPLSLREAPDVEPRLDAAGGVEFAVAVSTDALLVLRQRHLDTLRDRCKPGRWRYAETRTDTLQQLKGAKPHLVYFYCHGGVTPQKLPYLEVGPPNSGGGILRDNLRAYGIRWEAPRPLVLLNGCHTTALEPEAAIELVSGFVENCQASGVIGTEITIFEPLACKFAEELLPRFFVDRLPIGEAVRRTRLALLREANPLGLVYIPFVCTGLHVV